MKTWLRLLLVLLTVGGGYTGLVMTFDVMGNAHGFMHLLVLLAFLGMYGFVVVSGLILLFGTHFQFRAGGAGDDPLALGVNVVALALFILALRSDRLSRKASKQIAEASAVDHAPAPLAP